MACSYAGIHVSNEVSTRCYEEVLGAVIDLKYWRLKKAPVALEAL